MPRDKLTHVPGQKRLDLRPVWDTSIDIKPLLRGKL